MIFLLWITKMSILPPDLAVMQLQHFFARHPAPAKEAMAPTKAGPTF